MLFILPSKVFADVMGITSVSYIGCFEPYWYISEDNEARIYKMTPEACAQRMYYSTSSSSLPSFSQVAICGSICSKLPLALPVRVANTSCTVPCQEGGASTCGGGWSGGSCRYLSVYKVELSISATPAPPPPPTLPPTLPIQGKGYVACYFSVQNDPPIVYNGQNDNHTNNFQPSDCLNYIPYSTTSYFAVCGSTCRYPFYPSFSTVTFKYFCDRPCTGDTNSTCGGNPFTQLPVCAYYSVYSVSDWPPVLPTTAPPPPPPTTTTTPPTTTPIPTSTPTSTATESPSPSPPPTPTPSPTPTPTIQGTLPPPDTVVVSSSSSTGGAGVLPSSSFSSSATFQAHVNGSSSSSSTLLSWPLSTPASVLVGTTALLTGIATSVIVYRTYIRRAAAAVFSPLVQLPDIPASR